MNTLVGMITGAGGQKMCMNCKTKPVFQGHDYCGKTCADWAKANPPAPQAAPPGWGQPPPAGPPGWGGYPGYGPPPTGPPPQQQGQWGGGYGYPQQPPQPPQQQQQAPAQGTCQNCHLKPVFPGHPYCSKTCGASAKKNGAQPQMPPAPAPGPPAAYGGYGPPQPQWSPQGPPQGGPPQGWPQSPPQQGGPWGGPPQGGQPWGAPQQNWGQGPQGRPPRRGGRSSMPGGYGDDDDEWPDDDEYYDNAPPPRRARRAPPVSPPKAAKMCINCGDNPSVGKLEFCSKTCKAEAEEKLSGGKRPAAHRRVGSGARGPARRRQEDFEDFD